MTLGDLASAQGLARCKRHTSRFARGAETTCCGSEVGSESDSSLSRSKSRIIQLTRRQQASTSWFPKKRRFFYILPLKRVRAQGHSERSGRREAHATLALRWQSCETTKADFPAGANARSPESSQVNYDAINTTCTRRCEKVVPRQHQFSETLSALPSGFRKLARFCLITGGWIRQTVPDRRRRHLDCHECRSSCSSSQVNKWVGRRGRRSRSATEWNQHNECK